MTAKFILALLVAFCAMQDLHGSALYRRDLGSDLIETFINKSLPTIEKYFTPLSNIAVNASANANSLLLQLASKSSSYVLNVTSSFQSFRDVINKLAPRLQKIGEDVSSCVVTENGNVTDIINAAETQAKSCVQGLETQLQPIAANITTISAQLLGAAKQLYPAVTNCVGTNIGNPRSLFSCLTKVIQPEYSQVLGIVSAIKGDLKNYQQITSALTSQIQQCSASLKPTIASVQGIVQEVQQCVSDKEKSASS